MLSDCDWSIHFWRRAPASTSHFGSISNAVAYRRAQVRRDAVDAGEVAVEVLEVGDHHLVPQARLPSGRAPGIRSTTVNSPDRFDFTNRFW